ncbi:MAG: ribonuclease HII [Longimicrobiales bacterium]
MTSPASTPDSEDFGRLQDPLEYERRFWSRGVLDIAGVDEAGRGPLAGPVVAAAVVLPPDTVIEGAADSKVLSAEDRATLYDVILDKAVAAGIGAASVCEIDRANILVATAWAMRRALQRLPDKPGHVVVDGLPMKSLRWRHEAVVDGDALVHSISCASILAKVCRDRLMHKLAARYPEYGWETNVGYGTKEHREALERHGPTPHHRQTFLGLQFELEI